MGYRITRYVIDDVPAHEGVNFNPISLCRYNRSVLHGIIVDCQTQEPVAGAIVKIFLAPESVPVCLCSSQLVDLGHVFTDECGQFMFPVTITPGAKFLIKVFAAEPPVAFIGAIESCDPSAQCDGEIHVENLSKKDDASTDFQKELSVLADKRQSQSELQKKWWQFWK